MATNTIDAVLLQKMFIAGAKNLESKKEWINKLTFLKSNRKYGNYEIILAFGYNETTGEYTPISNTIEYTVE